MTVPISLAERESTGNPSTHGIKTRFTKHYSRRVLHGALIPHMAPITEVFRSTTLSCTSELQGPSIFASNSNRWQRRLSHPLMRSGKLHEWSPNHHSIKWLQWSGSEHLTPNHLLLLCSEPQMPPWVIPKGRLLLPTKMETSAISRRYLLEAMV